MRQPCKDCNMTGQADKVNRGFFAPGTCQPCKGSGWIDMESPAKKLPLHLKANLIFWLFWSYYTIPKGMTIKQAIYYTKVQYADVMNGNYDPVDYYAKI